MISNVHEPERQQHLETLKQTPERLAVALKGVPRKLAAWRPAPGKWSILEIVCHLRDMERDAYLARYRRVLAEENPMLPDVDGDVYALEKGYRAENLSAAFREWKRLRRVCLALLRTVKAEQWLRIGTHETAGPLSMRDFLRRQAVGNDAAHLGQIEAIKRRHELLAKLESGPKTLAEAVRGLDPQAARRRPQQGKWAIVEIACHLRDVELVFAERFSKMAFGERPQLWMLDNERVAAAKRYAEADLAATVKEFGRLREETLTLLRALPTAAWGRTGLHPKRGDVTIERLAQVLAEHDAGHLGRIRELRSA